MRSPYLRGHCRPRRRTVGFSPPGAVSTACLSCYPQLTCSKGIARSPSKMPKLHFISTPERDLAIPHERVTTDGLTPSATW